MLIGKAIDSSNLNILHSQIKHNIHIDELLRTNGISPKAKKRFLVILFAYIDSLIFWRAMLGNGHWAEVLKDKAVDVRHCSLCRNMPTCDITTEAVTFFHFQFLMKTKLNALQSTAPSLLTATLLIISSHPPRQLSSKCIQTLPFPAPMPAAVPVRHIHLS